MSTQIAWQLTALRKYCSISGRQKITVATPCPAGQGNITPSVASNGTLPDQIKFLVLDMFVRAFRMRLLWPRNSHVPSIIYLQRLPCANVASGASVPCSRKPPRITW